MTSRLLIVGEQPSGTGGDALAGRAGDRLAELAGITRDRYLTLRRANLLATPGRWDRADAAVAAKAIDAGEPDHVELLLLGRRVAAAFDVPAAPWFTSPRLPSGRTVYLIPHPSGRNRLWNDHETRRRARAFLATVGLATSSSVTREYRLVLIDSGAQLGPTFETLSDLAARHSMAR